MATLAAYAFVHVDLMAEVNEIRQVMDACPDQRFVVAIASAHRLEHGRVRPDLRMAVHAGLSRRDTREGRVLHRSVAIAAINAESGSVVLVAERDRLLRGDSLA